MLDVFCETMKFSDYGLCLEEMPDIPVAEQEIIFHDGIDDRDGALTEYGALQDRAFSFPVNYLGDKPAKKVLREFRGKLLALRNFKMRLSDELDIYYLVKSVKMGNISNEIEEHGSFNLSIVIDPFDYNWEPKVVTGGNSVNVQNNGTYHALPVITVTGSGSVSILTNSGTPVAIVGLNGSVVIDSEKLDFYNPSNPSIRNIKVHARKFPTLPAGNNVISTTGNVTAIKVEFKERFR